MSSRLAIGVVGLGCGLAACAADPLFPMFGDERVFDDHREVDIRFESGGATLSGTLYLPLVPGRRSATAFNPGSSWTTRVTWDDVTPFVTALSVGVFSWDKPGHGTSGGICCDPDPNVAFDRLAGDVVEAVEAVRRSGRVDPDQVGVFGSSQGGWIVPLAANEAPAAVAFVIVAVGGAVSTGQEGVYDRLTGYDVCQPTGRPMD